MPNDESVDIFVAVDDILKRIDCTTLATLSPDDCEAGRRSYAALRYNGADAAKPARKRRPRKPTLAGALKQASKAGVDVKGATLAADGSVSLQFGEAEPSEASNPWDAEIERLTKQ
jgi:hypothetical protein